VLGLGINGGCEEDSDMHNRRDCGLERVAYVFALKAGIASGSNGQLEMPVF
jgi:hypothetical protein